MRPERRERAVAALACGLESAVVFYALIRIIQALISNEPNPATVMQSAHAGFFWRSWIAAYGGGFVALAVAFMARSTQRIVSFVTRTLPFAAALLAAQALLLP